MSTVNYGGKGAREETPSEPESSGGDDEEEDEDGEEREVTRTPHSPSPGDLLSIGDIFSKQEGIFIDVRQSTRPQMETGSMTGPSPLPRLELVSPNL
jgi:hypothetical protein